MAPRKEFIAFAASPLVVEQQKVNGAGTRSKEIQRTNQTSCPENLDTIPSKSAIDFPARNRLDLFFTHLFGPLRPSHTPAVPQNSSVLVFAFRFSCRGCRCRHFCLQHAYLLCALHLLPLLPLYNRKQGFDIFQDWEENWLRMRRHEFALILQTQNRVHSPNRLRINRCFENVRSNRTSRLASFGVFWTQDVSIEDTRKSDRERVQRMCVVFTAHVRSTLSATMEILYKERHFPW